MSLGALLLLVVVLVVVDSFELARGDGIVCFDDGETDIVDVFVVVVAKSVSLLLPVLILAANDDDGILLIGISFVALLLSLSLLPSPLSLVDWFEAQSCCGKSTVVVIVATDDDDRDAFLSLATIAIVAAIAVDVGRATFWAS